MEFDNSDHSAGVSLGIIPVCLLRAVGGRHNLPPSPPDFYRVTELQKYGAMPSRPFDSDSPVTYFDHLLTLQID